jgi:hypothetical protein
VARDGAQKEVTSAGLKPALGLVLNQKCRNAGHAGLLENTNDCTHALMPDANIHSRRLNRTMQGTLACCLLRTFGCGNVFKWLRLILILMLIART